MPLVSVIIPTYNRIDLLIETLNSVLRQTFADREIIVVDDGSTDGTRDSLAGFGTGVRLVPLPHIGRLDTVRNHGLAAARGELITFLDSDDLWHPDKLALQVAAMERQPQVGMVFTNVVVLLPDGSVTPPVLSTDQKRSDGVFQRLLTGCFIHPSTVMVRRALFDQLGPFETRFRSQGDYIFWMRAAQAMPAYCLVDALVTVRRSATSMSQHFEVEMMQDAIKALYFVSSTEKLTLMQRLLVRRTLARWYVHMSRLEAEPAQTRQYLRQSLRFNPVQRQAWFELANMGTKQPP